MENVTVIVNVAAGGGRALARFQKLLPRIAASGLTLDVHETRAPGHATELARDASRAGAKRFLVVGGDGTSFEVVNGLFPREANDVSISMLPAGTGNSFLRDFGVVDEEAAVKAIVGGRPHPVDVIRLTHEGGTLHFINLLGLGFTASVGKLTNDRFKPLGALGYVAAVVAKVATLEHPRDPVSLDGAAVDARQAAMLVFSNSKYTGGAMMMAPNADVADGMIEIIRVGALSRLSLLRQFPRIFSGTHVNGTDVEESRARTVTFAEPRRQPCMIDGEILDLVPLSLDVLPRALTVIA